MGTPVDFLWIGLYRVALPDDIFHMPKHTDYVHTWEIILWNYRHNQCGVKLKLLNTTVRRAVMMTVDCLCVCVCDFELIKFHVLHNIFLSHSHWHWRAVNQIYTEYILQYISGNLSEFLGQNFQNSIFLLLCVDEMFSGLSLSRNIPLKGKFMRW